jgi:predicted nucleic acid-binding protein
VSWLLDADVLSQPAKRHGDPRVTAWLETEQDDCYTSAVVLSQLAYWVRSKEGRERQELQAWLTRLMAALHGRVLSFNASVAHVWAEQQHELERSGRRMPIEDSYIAATARRYNLTIVTGNERHFRRPGLNVFNPLKVVRLLLVYSRMRSGTETISMSFRRTRSVPNNSWPNRVLSPSVKNHRE